MLETIVTIIVVRLLIIGAVAAFAATRPSAFRIARSARIAAPPDKIYPLIDDFHRWPHGRPTRGLDPTMKRTYGGAERASAPPMPGRATTRPEPVGWRSWRRRFPPRSRSGWNSPSPSWPAIPPNSPWCPMARRTTVTWAMTGSRPLMMKVMGVSSSMDKMVGKDFETGLNSMRTAGRPDPRTTVPKEQPMNTNAYLNYPGTCEEAFDFYAKCLNSRIVAMIRTSDTPMKEQARDRPPGQDHACPHGHRRHGADGFLRAAELLQAGPGFLRCLNVPEIAEAERVYAALSEGGTVQRDRGNLLGEPCFATFTDKDRTPWIINCEKPMG